MNTAELICAVVSRLGLDTAFGLPGTQLIPLYAALRHSKVRMVLASHELSAAFMANGYYRASGRPALLITIPGPGFTYTLNGLAEAKHDSAALVYVLVRKQKPAGGMFGFQVIDQHALAQPLVKGYLTITSPSEVAGIFQQALKLATSGQPGPVIVEVDVDILPMSADASAVDFTVGPGKPSTSPDAETIVERLRASKKPVLLLGQGTQEGSESALKLAELLCCPVVTTISGRGVLPEDHSNLVAPDFGLYGVSIVNELVAACDLVLAVACKFSHNGSGGFRLTIPREKLIHVDADPSILNQNYPASLAVTADAPTILNSIVKSLAGAKSNWTWTAPEILKWRTRFLQEIRSVRPHFPQAIDCTPPDISQLFTTLRKLLPRECTIVADSGLHQYLTRCYFEIFSVRGLVVPTDYQSMGYGLPAAIGAKLAQPDRPTVLITGDGSFAMTGMELASIVREKVPVTVIVFNDSVLGLIREQQTDLVGHTFGVDLQNPDFELFAASMDLPYYLLSDNYEDQLKSALGETQGALVEIRLRPTSARQSALARSQFKHAVKRKVHSSPMGKLLRLFKR